MNKSVKWAVWLCCFFCPLVNAVEFSFEPVLDERQQAKPLVHQLAMDEDGFIWAVDSMTLMRFDGYRFDDVVSNLVGNDVLIDDKKRIWATGIYSLVMFDSQTSELHTFKNLLPKGQALSHHLIRDLVQLPNGPVVAVGDQGLSVFDERSAKFKTFNLASEQQPHEKSLIGTAILPLSSKRMLIGTNVGLYQVPFDALEQSEVDSIDLGEAILPHVDVRALTEVQPERVIVSGFDGFYDVNVNAGVVRHFQHSDTEPQSLSDNAVNKAVAVSDSEVWLATGLGLDSYDLSSGQVKRLLDEPALEQAIGSKSISDLYRLNDQILVAATSGIYRFRLQQHNAQPLKPRLKQLSELSKLKNAWSLKYSGDGKQYVGTYGLGLFEIDSNGKHTRYTYAEQGRNRLSGNNVSVIEVDRQGRLWVGTSKGLNWREQGQQGFSSFLPSALSGVAGIDVIRDIYQDDEDNLWFLSTRGVIEVDAKLNLKRTFTKESEPPLRVDKWATSVKVINNRLLIGSDIGFSVIDLSSNREMRFIPTNGVARFFEDSQGQLWVLSFDTLYLFNRQNLSLEAMPNDGFFTQTQKAKGVGFYNIAEDRFGQFWLAWSGGVKVFDPLSRSFIRTVISEGNFAELNLLFGRDSMRLRPDGQIAFAEVNGVFAFEPVEVSGSSVPKLLISTLKSDANAENGAPSKLVAIDGTKQATAHFDYPLRRLSFEFSVPFAKRPDTTQYQYRLLGLESEWHNNQSDRRVDFTGLSDGDYQLQVQALADGKQSAVLSYDFTIAKPLWKRWWALLGYGLSMALALWMVVKLRSRALQTQVNQLEARVKARTAELEKTNHQVLALMADKEQLVENVFHQSRTPIQLMLADINGIKSGSLPLNEYIDRQYRNIDRLVHLTELVTSGEGLSAPKTRVMQVCELLNDIAQRYVALAKKQRFEFSYAIDDEVWLNTNENLLEDILDNLLSNSFKYTECGAVNLKITIAGDSVLICCKDSGIGIADEVLKHIAKRRVRGDNVGNIQGQGLGMAIVDSAVQQLGGSWEVNSRLGQGTEVIVQFALADIKSRGESLAEQAKLPDLPQHLAESERAKLLLVEDNPELAEFYRQILSQYYQVSVINDAKAGFAAAQSESPALIICDVMLGEHNGFDFLKAVRSDAKTQHLPVIMLTAKADHDSKLKGYQLGANDYIVKPVMANELVIRVNNQLTLLNNSKKRPKDTQQFGRQRELQMEDKLISAYLSFIEMHYSDADLTTEQISNALYVTRRQMERKVKQHLDMTPNQYLMNYRLNQALSMLEQGQKVKEVYGPCGFSSHAYFSKRFKEKYGCSPSEYLATN